jgi:hypothetical protein
MVFSESRQWGSHRSPNATVFPFCEAHSSPPVPVIRECGRSSVNVAILTRFLQQRLRTNPLRHCPGFSSKSPLQPSVEPQLRQAIGSSTNIGAAPWHDLSQVLAHQLFLQHQPQQFRFRPLASTNQAGAHGNVISHILARYPPARHLPHLASPGHLPALRHLPDPLPLLPQPPTAAAPLAALPPRRNPSIG